MDRVEVIQAIIDRTHATEYLEIGVETGLSFVPLRVDSRTGVDPALEWRRRRSLARRAGGKLVGKPSVKVHQRTSDDFFSRLDRRRKFDVIFVDGLHTYEQVVKDVSNSLDHLTSGGVIVLHDCNPPTEASAHPARDCAHAESLGLPGWTGAWCGDVWKAVCHLRSQRDDLRVFVLDCDTVGVGIVTVGDNDTRLAFSQSELDAMTFADLDADRTNLLDLRDEAYLSEFLSSLSPIRE